MTKLEGKLQHSHQLYLKRKKLADKKANRKMIIVGVAICVAYSLLTITCFILG